MTAKTPRKVGRPTSYKPEYCQTIIEHFDIPLTYETTEEKMSASGAVEELRVTKPANMPTFEGFARSILVCMDTLSEWKVQHKAFSASYRICKGIQKEFLLAHGLTGGYNSGFAKFVAINCTDMMDTSHVNNAHDVTEDAKKVLTLAYKLED